MVDLAARKLRVDPVRLRHKNIIAASRMPYRTALAVTYDCGDFGLPLDRALELAEWNEFHARRRESARRGMLRGIGIGSYVEVAAFFNDKMEIQIEPDGSATIIAGTVSSGQGHETVFAKLLHEWLGIAPESVRLVTGDTAIVSFGRGTFGSRSMTVCGSALKMASDRIVEKAKDIAAELLEANRRRHHLRARAAVDRRNGPQPPRWRPSRPPPIVARPPMLRPNWA